MRVCKIALTLIAFVQIFFSDICVANEKTDRQKDCEQLWEQKNSSDIDYAEVLDAWVKLKSKCQGTGIYEFRLANLYERTGNMKKAQAIVAKALTLNTRYQHILILSTLLYDYANLLTSDSRDLNKFEALLKRTKALSDNHPNWAPPVEHMASIFLYLGRVGKAIQYANRAIELNPSSWSGRRTLILVHAENKDYAKVRPLITKTLQLNDSLFSDTEIMYASAITYINLNELETAEQVLLLLRERNPDVVSDKTFLQIVDFLIAKKKEFQDEKQ